MINNTSFSIKEYDSSYLMFILIYTICIYYVNKYWKSRLIWNLKEEPISLKSRERPFSWCNIAFYFLSTRKTGKTSICKKQVIWLITMRYLLVRINLNKLEEREIGNRAGVFPFAFLVWFFLIVIGPQFLNHQELITEILMYGLRKITVLPSISSVITDMMKSIVLFLTRHIKISTYRHVFFLRWLYERTTRLLSE